MRLLSVEGFDVPVPPAPPLTSFIGCRSRILAFLSRRQTDSTTWMFGVCSSMALAGYRTHYYSQISVRPVNQERRHLAPSGGAQGRGSTFLLKCCRKAA